MSDLPSLRAVLDVVPAALIAHRGHQLAQVGPARAHLQAAAILSGDPALAVLLAGGDPYGTLAEQIGHGREQVKDALYRHITIPGSLSVVDAASDPIVPALRAALPDLYRYLRDCADLGCGNTQIVREAHALTHRMFAIVTTELSDVPVAAAATTGRFSMLLDVPQDAVDTGLLADLPETIGRALLLSPAAVRIEHGPDASHLS